MAVKKFSLCVKRWKPDFKYRDDKLTDIDLSLPIDKSKSLTDKESYRITLASLRGELSNGSLGSMNEGNYSIPAGEKYNPNVDISYIMRPDITIVEMDNYITDFRLRLEKSDEMLAQEMQQTLDEMIRQRDLKEKQESDNSSDE